MPPGTGLWPAFWLYGVSDIAPKPEIDIFESIGDGKIYVANHLNGNQTQYSEVATLTDDYHIYAAKWEADKVSFYLDNVLITEIATNVPSTAMNVMLDLYIGGAWPGDPVGVTFPVYFDVDYVKVWQSYD